MTSESTAADRTAEPALLIASTALASKQTRAKYSLQVHKPTHAGRTKVAKKTPSR
jgi:hypothetical protein